MFTVAGPLTFFYQLPFWYTWLTVGLGELLSMTVGGILIYVLNKKIQLVKRIEEKKSAWDLNPKRFLALSFRLNEVCLPFSKGWIVIKIPKL